MKAALPPCGTRAAESRHRQDGAWPCYVCLDVRTDVSVQLTVERASALQVFARRLTFGTFTPEERLDIAREVHALGVDVPRFAFLLSLPTTLAQRLYVLLTDQPRRGPCNSRKGARVQ